MSKTSSPRKAQRKASRKSSKVDDEKSSEAAAQAVANETNEANEKEEDKDLVELDLYNSDDILKLDDIFDQFDKALKAQKAKLAAKWVSNYTKRDPATGSKKLLLDVKSHLRHISKLGLLKGYKFEELETEQNKAIAKLEEVLKLEENARVSRNRAIEIQNETELEMKAIDEQRAIIAKELAKAEPELKKARSAVSSISDAALNELVSLQKPPSVVANVLTVAVWIIHSKVETVEKEASRAASPRAPRSPSVGGGNSSRPASSRHKAFFGSDALNPDSADTEFDPKSRENLKSPKKKGKTPKHSISKSQTRSSRPTSSRRDPKKSKEKKVDILAQPWRDTRKLIAGSGFKKEILAFDPKTLSKEVCTKIETDFLTQEDFTYERANTASKVLGPLVQWVVSLVAYGKVWYKIRPLAMKVAELETQLAWKTQEVVRLRETSEVMHEKVIAIRGEILVMIGYKKVDDLYFNAT